MHVVVEFLDAKPHHRGALRMSLLLLSRVMLERKMGCHTYDICQDDLDGSAFLIYQVYETKAALLAHHELPEYAEHRLMADPWIVTRRTLSYELISKAATG